MRDRLRVSKSCARKWLLVIAIIIGVCAVVFGIMNMRSCKEWLANKAATADVDVVGISFKGISLTAVTVDVTVSVHNSNPDWRCPAQDCLCNLFRGRRQVGAIRQCG